MNVEDRYEFFKRLHEKEFERKDKIEENLTLPITIIVGVVAFIYFLINEFDFKFDSQLKLYFKPLIFTGGSLLLLSIVFTIIVYLSRQYRAEPYADKLDNYRQELLQYWIQVDPANAETMTKEDFLKYITDLYVSQTTNNTLANDARTKWVTRIKLALMLSVSSLILSLVPFYFNYFNKPDKIHNIYIPSLSQHIDSLNNIIQIMKCQNQNLSNQPQTTSPTPTKPTPPPERLIRQGRHTVERPSPPSPLRKK